MIKNTNINFGIDFDNRGELISLLKFAISRKHISLFQHKIFCLFNGFSTIPGTKGYVNSTRRSLSAIAGMVKNSMPENEDLWQAYLKFLCKKTKLEQDLNSKYNENLIDMNIILEWIMTEYSKTISTLGNIKSKSLTK